MNTINLSKRFYLTATVILLTFGPALQGHSQAADPTTATGSAAPAAPAKPPDLSEFQADNDNLSGEKLWLKTDLTVENAGDTTKTGCIPNDSRLKVHSDTGGSSFFRVLEVGPVEVVDTNSNNKKTVLVSGCGNATANTYTLYKSDSAVLKTYAAKRSGPVFGGLVVPFKYNFSTRKIDSSPTMAPFVGYRLRDEFLGMSVAPVFMVGVGMKTGTAAGSGTQAMLSTGFGLRLSSSKNENWHGGVLFGRDYGRGTEAATTGTPGAPNTSTQGKAFNWFSAFLGYSM